MEEQKLKVDQAHLRLENLKYIESHLNREIQSCRNLLTPSLNAVEIELQRKLAVERITDSFLSDHENALTSLRDEFLKRQEAQEALKMEKVKLLEVTETLERKRKSFEELQDKVSKVYESLVTTVDPCKTVTSRNVSEQQVIENTVPPSLHALYLSLCRVRDEQYGRDYNHSFSVTLSVPMSSLDSPNKRKKSSEASIHLTIQSTATDAINTYDSAAAMKSSVTLRFYSNGTESSNGSDAINVTVDTVELIVPDSCPFHAQDFHRHLFLECSYADDGAELIEEDSLSWVNTLCGGLCKSSGMLATIESLIQKVLQMASHGIVLCN